MYHIYMWHCGCWSWHEGPYNEAAAAARVDELNKTAAPGVCYMQQKWEPVPYETVLW